MLQNSRGINPLNWQQFIDEALYHRKVEKLTQREHAALANVSIPTIAAFERGELTLSLAKAFDILRVVGLVEKKPLQNDQDDFVAISLKRWKELIKKLPQNSPGRLLQGWYQFDYHLEGDLESIDLKKLLDILEHISQNPYTGWPPFFAPKRENSIFTPVEMNGTLECWLDPHKSPTRLSPEPAYCDYWRADPKGRLFLMRGYKEDSEETFPPGSVFDNILPIWRMGEVFLHAEKLAYLLQKNSKSLIMLHFRAIYNGLSGRVLRSWSNPLNSIFFEQGSGASKSNEVVLQTIVPVKDVSSHLSEYIYPLVASLYERFGVTELSKEFVDKQIKALVARRNNDFSSLSN